MTVHVGGPALLTREGVTELPVADEWRRHGAIILHVVVDGAVVGGLSLADEIREESRAAITALHERGIEVVMNTGAADAVATTEAAEHETGRASCREGVCQYVTISGVAV